MEYVTIAGVQSKFGGEISFTVAKKMLDRMAEEGYIKQTASNRRMGNTTLKTSNSWKLNVLLSLCLKDVKY